MKYSSSAPLLSLFAVLCGLHTSVSAASLTLNVSDVTGRPAIDAVVYAEPASGQALPKQLRSVQIEQKARKFLPTVTVIQSGTAVSFPNHDSVRHHVYSFSSPKVFELKLYSGAGGDPIIFDKVGTVVVGCNIHDQMAAFIQIVDTPYFGKTDASGKVTIDNMLPGKYQVKVWHPAVPATMVIPGQPVTLANADITLPILLTFKIEKN
jgi:plastocyanin